MKNIIITGASSGFGAEIAKIFAKDGHNLLLLARRVELMEDLNLENAMIRKVDVTNFDEFSFAVSEFTKKFGEIDLLVNNAGVMKLGVMGTQSRSDYDTMINVNINGVINGIEAVIKGMKKNKNGTIINVSSTAGIKTYPEHAVYSGTKFAVMGITETLRQELAPFNVRVTALCPGAFSTELLSHTKDKKIIDDYNQWKKTMGDMAKPIEVAKIVKYIFDAPQNLTFREVVMHSTKQIG